MGVSLSGVSGSGAKPPWSWRHFHTWRTIWTMQIAPFSALFMQFIRFSVPNIYIYFYEGCELYSQIGWGMAGLPPPPPRIRQWCASGLSGLTAISLMDELTAEAFLDSSHRKFELFVRLRSLLPLLYSLSVPSHAHSNFSIHSPKIKFCIWLERNQIKRLNSIPSPLGWFRNTLKFLAHVFNDSSLKSYLPGNQKGRSFN